MRKLLLATTALAALVGAPAFAADMAARVYKAPPPVAPMFSWTGFYVGLNGGYGWGHDPVSFSAANAAGVPYFAGGAVPGGVTTNPAGGLFGGQIGYNYQWSSFVAGIETDIDWASIKGNGAVSTTAVGFAPFTTTVQQKLTSLGTFRGRLGFAADRALFYGTGGLAYGRTQPQHRRCHADDRLRPGGPLRRLVVDAMADRLDRRRRYGIRLCRGMERQDRISALRSRQPHPGTIRSCGCGADPGVQFFGDVPRQHRPRRLQLPLRRLTKPRTLFRSWGLGNAGALFLFKGAS